MFRICRHGRSADDDSFHWAPQWSISISITLRYRQLRLCSVDSPFIQFFFLVRPPCIPIFALNLTIHFFFSIRASIYLPGVANDIKMSARFRSLNNEKKRNYFCGVRHTFIITERERPIWLISFTLIMSLSHAFCYFDCRSRLTFRRRNRYIV